MFEEPATGFAALGLRSEVMAAVSELGYDEPTPIQREAIPHLLTGVDLLGQAATGTGKTAAFSLPILHSLDMDQKGKPRTQALIVVPTRELAVQVRDAVAAYGKKLGVKVLAVFGGQPIVRQFKELDRGVHVVVATPGRAMDHIRRGSLKLGQISTVVLDEADEMLDMGFAEDIDGILDATPDERQTVLFSATMAPRIVQIAKKYQHDPIKVEIARSKADDASKALIKQSVYFVPRKHKAAALGRILDIENPTSALVFCRTRMEVDELTVTMNNRGYRAEALHGGMDQLIRDRVMGRLRDGIAELLIATDVAARGLDVDSLTHVVNYDVPTAPESYVHRIGRVGRAGRAGTAITLSEPGQRRLLSNIERLMKKSIDVAKVPSVADLRASQALKTADAVRESLESSDLEDFAAVLDHLNTPALDGPGVDDAEVVRSAFDHDGFSAELDTAELDTAELELSALEEAGLDHRQVALAALRLLHLAQGGGVVEQEIPDVSAKGKQDKGKHDKGAKGKHGKGAKPWEKKGSGGPKGGSSHGGDGDTGYLYVNLGRKVGVRPSDLVGAVANEAGLTGRDIGPIRINEHYAVVGVPEESVDHVIRSMKSTKVRGRPATVRRFKE